MLSAGTARRRADRRCGGRRRRGGPGRGRGRGAERTDGQGGPPGDARKPAGRVDGTGRGPRTDRPRSSRCSPSTNRHGLHARPAARLVSEVRGLDAAVRLRNLTTGAGPVPAGSLSRVATLGALHGHRVEIRASRTAGTRGGRAALALAARHFDEPPEERVQPPAQGNTARVRCRPRPASASDRSAGSAATSAAVDEPPAGESGGGVATGRGGAWPRFGARSSGCSGSPAEVGAPGGADLRRAPDAARRRGTARRRQGPGRLRGRCGHCVDRSVSRRSRSNGRTCPTPICVPARRTSEPSAAQVLAALTGARGAHHERAGDPGRRGTDARAKQRSSTPKPCAESCSRTGARRHMPRSSPAPGASRRWWRRGQACSTLAEGTTIVIDGATGELVVDPSAAVLGGVSTAGGEAGGAT